MHPHPPVDPDDGPRAPASLTAPATRVVYAYDDRPRAWVRHRARACIDDRTTTSWPAWTNGVADLPGARLSASPQDRTKVPRA